MCEGEPRLFVSAFWGRRISLEQTANADGPEIEYDSSVSAEDTELSVGMTTPFGRIGAILDIKSRDGLCI